MAISEDDQAAISACDKWAILIGKPNSYSTMLAFTAFLGDPFNDVENRDRIVDMRKPEIRRKVEIINNSPHWYALLKVMEARDG